MTTSTDHYEVLGVARDASERDVKRAFFALLKENPPEQKPQEYQRLREAYDVLSDAVARKEYDSLSAFGPEIEALKAEAERLFNADEPDLAGAIRALKKAVVLGPEIAYLRNLLGRCYMESEAPAEALKQFEKAAEINPNNEAYLLNRGHALASLNRKREAEAVFRSVWAQDPEDYAAPRALADLLHDDGRSDEAHAVLDQAIGADGKLDFQDFFCLNDKLHLYLIDGQHDALEPQLDVIVRVAQDEPDRQFAAFMLSRTASQLSEVKEYRLASVFAQSARTLTPDDRHLGAFADGMLKAGKVDEAVREVCKDGSTYHAVVQDLVRIHAGRYLEYLSQDVYSDRLSDLLETTERLIEIDPHASLIKTSLRKLKRDHRATFDLNSELFEFVLSQPAAEAYGAACPFCSKSVVVEKTDVGMNPCPHCRQAFRYNGTKFERPEVPKPVSKPRAAPAPRVAPTRPVTPAPHRSSPPASRGVHDFQGYGGVSVCIHCGCSQEYASGRECQMAPTLNSPPQTPSPRTVQRAQPLAGSSSVSRPALDPRSPARLAAQASPSPHVRERRQRWILLVPVAALLILASVWASSDDTETTGSSYAESRANGGEVTSDLFVEDRANEIARYAVANVQIGIGTDALMESRGAPTMLEQTRNGDDWVYGDPYGSSPDPLLNDVPPENPYMLTYHVAGGRVTGHTLVYRVNGTTNALLLKDAFTAELETLDGVDPINPNSRRGNGLDYILLMKSADNEQTWMVMFDTRETVALTGQPGVPAAAPPPESAPVQSNRRGDHVIVSPVGYARVRAWPALTSQSLGEFVNGTGVTVERCDVTDSEGRPWCKVSVGGVRGWMGKVNLPDERGVPPISDGVGTRVIVSTVGYARVRAWPALTSRILGEFDNGTSVTVERCDVRDDEGRPWCKVSVGGIQGWMGEVNLPN